MALKVKLKKKKKKKYNKKSEEKHFYKPALQSESIIRIESRTKSALWVCCTTVAIISCQSSIQ